MSEVVELVIGVDGCRLGWVGVALDAKGFVAGLARPRFAELIDAFVAQLGLPAALGVDMPIGLMERGARDADVAARAFLRGQASSVFSAPVRCALGCEEHAQASALQREHAGVGLSKQSFHLFPKIRELDDFVGRAALGGAVHEVHPEIAFRLLKGGALGYRKKTWGGVMERRELLASAGVVLPSASPELGPVGVDDVLDAAAVAWSARRIARGEARSFPARPDQRDRGRLVVIRA